MGLAAQYLCAGLPRKKGVYWQVTRWPNGHILGDSGPQGKVQATQKASHSLFFFLKFLSHRAFPEEQESKLRSGGEGSKLEKGEEEHPIRTLMEHLHQGLGIWTHVGTEEWARCSLVGNRILITKGFQEAS